MKTYQLFSSCSYYFMREIQLSGFVRSISMTFLLRETYSSKIQLTVITQKIITLLNQQNYIKPRWCELVIYWISFLLRVTSEHLDCLGSQTITSKYTMMSPICANQRTVQSCIPICTEILCIKINITMDSTYPGYPFLWILFYSFLILFY